MSTATPTHEEVDRMLRRWQRAGLITAEQVRRIEATEAARQAVPPCTGEDSGSKPPLTALEPRHPYAASTPPLTGARRGSLLAGVGIGEALGYLGSTLIAVAVVVLAGLEWGHFAFAAKVSITAGPGFLLLAAGFFVPESRSGPGRRIQAVLWTASAGLFFGALAIVAADGFDWTASHVVLFAAAPITIYAAVLWRRSGVPILHVATFAALLATGAAAADQVSVSHGETAGVAVWILALCWAGLAANGVIRPRPLGIGLGIIAAVIAAQTTMSTNWGAVFAVLTTAAVIGLAVWQRSLLLLIIGAFALFTTVPAATDKLLPGSLGVGIGLLVAGLVLVACAMRVVRRHDHPTDRGPTADD